MGVGHAAYNVGFGDAAPLAVLLGRDGRQFSLGAGKDVAVALLQGVDLVWGEPFVLALRDTSARVLQEPLHVLSPGIAVRLMDEGEFAQQMGSTESLVLLMPKGGRNFAGTTARLSVLYLSRNARCLDD